MKLPTLKNINLKGKSVLLRIDINSPVVKGQVLDNPRFKASSKTLEELLEKGARVTIIAHQGRKGDSDFLPLKQHAEILSRYAKSNIKYIPDLFGEKARKAILSLKPSQAILLENTRAYKDETNPHLKNNHYPQFSKLFNLYVNDAFSVSHREQGSIIIPPKYLPSYIGRQFESELSALEKLTFKGNKKIAISLGGAKIEDYLQLFNLLNNKKNKLLASGVLANLLLIVKGYDLGYESKWLEEHNYNKLIPQLKKLLIKHKENIILPVDFGLNPDKNKRQDVSLEEAPFKYKIRDVGPETVEQFKREAAKSDIVFVKGPLGFSEIDNFSYGTVEFLRYLSNLSKSKKIYTIIGGGHSTTTIDKYNIPNTFNHISLSGGALIYYISGKKLPGIEAIKKSSK